MLAPLCLLVAAIGAGIGWAQRPADPFLTTPPPPAAPELPDAGRQYAFALLENSERGWLALLEHHGDTPAVAAKARDGLAKWYLDHDRPEDALRQAGKLEAVASTSLGGERQLGYKANAAAVRALAALRDGDEETFRSRIAALTASPQRGEVDSGLRDRLVEAIRAHGGLFDDDVRGRWDPGVGGEEP